ncbi:MAG: hypothetical protein KIG36_03995 [Eubacteriales bacterium]|nr:hypothetical protein [Eubacteriales bacterium]
MKNLMSMALKYVKIMILTALLAAGMMFALYQLPDSLAILKVIISLMFLAFQYVILWDNFVVFGAKDSRTEAHLRRGAADGIDTSAEPIRFYPYKGWLAALIGSVPWWLIYIASIVSRFVNLDPNIGSNVIFKFLYMFTNMPCYTIFLRLGLPDAIPFAFIIPLIISLAVAGTAYLCGHVYRFRVEKDARNRKYKHNVLD